LKDTYQYLQKEIKKKLNHSDDLADQLLNDFEIEYNGVVAFKSE
jgi:hypothetical protein